MKKTVAFIFTLSLVLVFAGCSNKQEMPYEPETIIGYIYIQEDELMVDKVEIVTRNDTERINELGLEESSDYPGGFAIYNPESDISSFELTDDTKYIFTDYKQLYVDENIENRLYETKKINEFIEGSSYQDIKLEDIISEKHYIPYFIEVFDGKVVSVKEEFIYTI